MLNKKIGLIALLTSVAAGCVWAETFTNFSTGEVLVCFRKGNADMVVDAGPIGTYTAGTANQRIPVNQYTGSQLTAAGGVNGTTWSAFAWQSDNTLFVTRPRTSVGTPTTPWQAYTSPLQFGSDSRMATIPPGASDALSIPVYVESTPGAVLEEDSASGNPNYTHGVSYHDALAGAYGSDFNGKFQGNPEITTLNSFSATPGAVVRSDFYQLSPTTQIGGSHGTWLGYFELTNNGTMTFVAKPTTTPIILSISRAGDTATISYQTGLYGTYTLLGSSDLSMAWTPIATLSTGDNLVHTYPDTDSADHKFYIIQGQ